MFEYDGNYVGFNNTNLKLYSFSGKFLKSFLWNDSNISLLDMIRVQTCKHEESEVFSHDIKDHGTRSVVYKCDKCQRYRSHYYVYDLDKRAYAKEQTLKKMRMFSLEEKKRRLKKEESRLEKLLSETSQTLTETKAEIEELSKSQKSQN